MARAYTSAWHCSGAVLAGMDRWSFMRAMDERGVAVIGYSIEDLEKDVTTLKPL